MFTRFARSVTPRAVGVVVLLAAAVTATVVAAAGHTTSSASPHPLAAVGGSSASAGTSGSSAAAPSSSPIVNAAVHHDLSRPLRTLRPVVVPNGGPQFAPDAGEGTDIAHLGPGGPDPVI